MSIDAPYDRRALLELTAKVKPRSARDYASANGWTRQGADYGKLAIFNHDTQDLTQLLIPIDSEAIEYPKMMFEVAEMISNVENRALLEVINDLLNPDADVVRYRIIDPSISSDLSLLRGIDVLEGAKRSLLAAAHSILAPQQYHPRLSRIEARTFIDECRLKQTEHGSFVVAISCPLDAVDSEGLLSGIDSFTRQTTKVLMNSLVRIEKLIDADDEESLTQVSRDEIPISANLCDALSRLEPPSEYGALEISTTWASTHPNTESPGRLSVHFPDDHFRVISDVGRRLRPDHQTELATFAGQVETLNGDLNTDGKRHGEVVLDLLYENELIRTRVMLDPDQYASADLAHMSGIPVVVEGELHRGRRICRLAKVTMFKIVSPEHLRLEQSSP